MAEERVERRLAAILAADVVGYSRLMGEDEEGTLATLKSYRSIIDALIETHAGRVFGGVGDSVIAEFASPVKAVRCATEIQLELDKRSADVPDERRMRFRIGVNLGDVIVEGDNLLGDGVNIAARLEAPGAARRCLRVRGRTEPGARPSQFGFPRPGRARGQEHYAARPGVPRSTASEERITSPFRGLDTFEFEHAGLFFGRAGAIAATKARLEQQAAAGTAFLLIYGMSGAGKSSLLRAGLLPALTTSGAVEGIALWRYCLIRPSEGSSPVDALVGGLLSETALPELAAVGTAAELAEVFRTTPEKAQGTDPIGARNGGKSGACRTAAGASGHRRGPRWRNCSPPRVPIRARAKDSCAYSRPWRAAILFGWSGPSGLISSTAAVKYRVSQPSRMGSVATSCYRQRGRRLLKSFASRRVQPASNSRKTHSRVNWRTYCRDAAARDPGSLPLLEFVLDALYDAGKERRLLTFAAYRALGGLGGAIAQRADVVTGALPPDVQDALPTVISALTTVRQQDEAATARPALRREIAATPAQAALVDALIDARLLVSDEGTEGAPMVRFAHEALLSQWPLAREIVAANREFLATRARVRADARRWLAEDRSPDLLLPPGKRLAEAEDVLLTRRMEIDDKTIGYIEASISAQRQRDEAEREADRKRLETEEAAKRERLELEADAAREREAAAGAREAAARRLARRTRIAAAVTLILAIGAGVGAFVGFRGQQEANRQADVAGENAEQARSAEEEAQRQKQAAIAARDTAVAARSEVLRTQSLLLAGLAQTQIASGDTTTAPLLALEALPKDMAEPDRPFVIEAEAALYQALLARREVGVFRHDGGVTHAAFSPEGDRIVTSSFDNTARVWSVRDGSEIVVLRGHTKALERAAFSSDGKRIVTAARDGTARVWDAETGREISTLQDAGRVTYATFSPDGDRVVTAAFDGGQARVWDARTGNRIASLAGTTLGSKHISFSPDGRMLATTHHRMVRLWAADDGKEIATLPHETELLNDRRKFVAYAVFSPDGSRLVTLSEREDPPRLFDVASRTEIAVLRGHTSMSLRGAFSPDGQLVATASIEGSVKLWDARTGTLVAAFGEETGIARAAEASFCRHRRLGNECRFQPGWQPPRYGVLWRA